MDKEIKISRAMFKLFCGSVSATSLGTGIYITFGPKAVVIYILLLICFAGLWFVIDVID